MSESQSEENIEALCKQEYSEDFYENDTDLSVTATDEIDKTEKRHRGKNKEYTELKITENYDDAKTFMKINMSEYIYRFTRISDDGVKLIHCCKGYQTCPKTAYILKSTKSQECSILQAEGDHQHIISTNKCKLPQNTVDFIKETLKNDHRISSARLRQKVKEQKLPQLTDKQLRNLKARTKLSNEKTILHRITKSHY